MPPASCVAVPTEGAPDIKAGSGFDIEKQREYVARWSSGQDGGLSRRKREFDSPTGHHLFSRGGAKALDKRRLVPYNMFVAAQAVMIVGVD